MVAVVRFVVGSLIALPPWLRFVYLISLTWAGGHCYITAYGSQAQREIAAAAGVFGAISILITLHVAIVRYVETEVRRRIRREHWQQIEINAASVLQRRSAPEADHSTSPPVVPVRHPSAFDR